MQVLKSIERVVCYNFHHTEDISINEDERYVITHNDVTLTEFNHSLYTRTYNNNAMKFFTFQLVELPLHGDVYFHDTVLPLHGAVAAEDLYNITYVHDGTNSYKDSIKFIIGTEGLAANSSMMRKNVSVL